MLVPYCGLQLQNKLSEARSTLQNSVDPNTGKRLFHPETGRAPRFSRNTSQQPVSEYLYSLSQQQVRGVRGRHGGLMPHTRMMNDSSWPQETAS